MHEFGIIIGQFQPFTSAHYELVKFALLKSKTTIIIIGSDHRPRTIELPWSSDERIEMIESCLSDDERKRVVFAKAKDYLYNENLWITQIQAKVDEIIEQRLNPNSKDVALFGYKNKPNHYSEMFPQWKFIDADDFVSDKVGSPPSSERIRQMYFTLDLLDVKRYVPAQVFELIKNDMMTDSSTRRQGFALLKEEFEHIQEYKAQWNSAPFPPTFETVDAVTIKSGHVLVVRRRSVPGKGLIALPGGFLNQTERLVDAAVRELKEETKIKLHKNEILLSLKDKEVFDHPNRSLRGRTITHAYCFNLGQGELPKVQGDDDADKAWWMSLRDVFASEDMFFEDHFHIINHFVNKF